MVNTIVAEMVLGDVLGSGTNVLVVYVTVSVSPTVTVVGSGIVTINPVGSTVGVTVVSEDVTVKVVPAGNAAPAGARVPVKTSVLPGSAGRSAMFCSCIKMIAVGVGWDNSFLILRSS